MSSPSDSLNGATEVREMKSDLRTVSLDVPPGEEIGRRSEDFDLSRFGYKPELERRFGLWSTIGLSCSTMVTWEGCAFGVALTDGGRAGAVYGFLFCWIGYTAVIACLSELVSMTPTAAGQYHWAYELSPPKYRKFISYATGWQIVLAWQADLAAVFYLTGTIIQGLVVLNYPDYHFERYHATLILWTVIVVAVLFNAALARFLVDRGQHPDLPLPGIYRGDCADHLLWATCLCSRRVCPVRIPWRILEWDSMSVGLIATVWSFLGADGAIHMSEEVRDARTNVPKALMTSVAINGVLGFGMVVAALFTMGDLDDIIAISTPVTGIPVIDYFYFALGSKVFATGLSSLLLGLFIFAAVAVAASTMRVTWAFARDNGLPGSSLRKKIESFKETFQNLS